MSFGSMLTLTLARSHSVRLVSSLVILVSMSTILVAALMTLEVLTSGVFFTVVPFVMMPWLSARVSESLTLVVIVPTLSGSPVFILTASRLVVVFVLSHVTISVSVVLVPRLLFIQLNLFQNIHGVPCRCREMTSYKTEILRPRVRNVRS